MTSQGVDLKLTPNGVISTALFGKGISNRSLEALPATLKEGDLVTITAEDDPRIVAVGQLTTSAKELLADRKGKAVLTVSSLLVSGELEVITDWDAVSSFTQETTSCGRAEPRKPWLLLCQRALQRKFPHQKKN